MLIATDIIRSELSGWRDSITVGSLTQDHALSRPSRVMDFSCALALIQAGVPEPDPFTQRRIVTQVDRFTEGDRHRACSQVDAHPRLFAEGAGLLNDWTSGRNAVGALAPEEWADLGIAVVWWRPHDEELRYRYIETHGADQLQLGEETVGKWGVRYRPVFGPPIPNNHREGTLWVRPLWPWTHAADRQLDLLGLGAS